MGRRGKIVAVAAAVTLAVLLAILAAFPWGMLRSPIERKASERFGRPVRIGAIERRDGFGFHPVIAIRDVTVPQPDWAGRGDVAKIGTVTLRFPVWPLLTGRLRPRDVTIDGLRLALMRTQDGRTNWDRADGAKGGDGDGPDIGRLTIRDALVTYADAKQDRQLTARIAADPATGLRVRGEGRIDRVPVRLTLAGPAPAQAPWPFTATIEGDRLAMRANGMMDRPLDPGRMTLDVTARAADLKLIDAVIEAGLFHTRAVALTAHVRRDPGRWAITALTGTIGRSDLAGRLTVDKVDGRSKIDGAITARAFDFGDLTSAEGRAEAAALAARIGPRLVPDTRIDIGKIARTDGRLAFRVGRIIGSSSPPIQSLSGVMTMDHRLLTLSPLRLRLDQGVVTGRAVVDQRRGQPSPTLTLDLTLAGGDVGAFAAGGAFTGRLAARVRLAGVGDTLRSAVGRSDGTVGFTVRHGHLPARYAAALGFDAGRALLAGSGDRAGLRCLIARLAMANGTGRAAPAIIDTDWSRMTAAGTVSFPDERLAMRLTGAPKRTAILRIPGAAILTGTITAPHLAVPEETKSVGNILKAIGRTITGGNGPLATDADCDRLAAQALR